MSDPSWNCFFSLTIDLRAWGSQPNEFIHWIHWEWGRSSPMRWKLSLPLLPPPLHLRARITGWSGRFLPFVIWGITCSFAHWTVSACSTSGLLGFLFSFSYFLLPVFIPVQTAVATKSAVHVFPSRSQQGIHAVPGGHGVWLLVLMGKGEERKMTNDEEEWVACF